jgi:hypothetical protein
MYLRTLYHRLTRPAPFAVEKSLLAGTHRTRSKQPSILHFSLNKAATQYTKNILRTIAGQNNLTPVGMNEWAFGSTQPYLDHLSHAEMEHYKQVFKPKGYLYSVFGGMIENIDHLPDYKILLMVRDPRDILVSSYFSTAFSHPLPGEQSDKRTAFEQKRAWAKTVTIDEYVLTEAPKLLKNLQRYSDLLLSRHPHTLLLRYEELITDFEGWLTRLLQYTGCNISATLRKQLLQNHQKIRPVTENRDLHLRKGIAGDYKEKLQPETIAELEGQFSGMLTVFGY